MSDNKRPPGYVPLTIHEIAASSKGKKGTGLDYVFGHDARAVDESILGSSAARAVTGSPRPTGGGMRTGGLPDNYSQGHSQREGHQQREGGGRRRNRRNRNNRRSGGEGEWGSDDSVELANGTTGAVETVEVEGE